MLSTRYFHGLWINTANSFQLYLWECGVLPEVLKFRHSENYFPIASLVCWIPDRRLSVMIATAEFNFSDSHASTSFSVCSSLCTYIGSTRCGGRWMMSKHNVHMQCMWLRGSWGPHFAQVCSAVKAAAVWCMHYTAKYWAPLLWTLWQLAGFL